MDKLTVLELHRVEYTDFEKTLQRLIRIHHPATILSDSQPYVETIYRLQNSIRNLYGALYVTNKSMELFRLLASQEDLSKAILRVRQVNINRNFAFNTLMDSIREGYIGVVPNIPDIDILAEHLQDMRRVPNGTRQAFSDGADTAEVEDYRWVKTSGNDHFHHALLYAYIAMYLVKHRQDSKHVAALLCTSFKIKNQNL